MLPLQEFAELRTAANQIIAARADYALISSSFREDATLWELASQYASILDGRSR